MSNSNLVHISWYNKVEVIFMNDLSKMYQVYVNKELQVNKNEILNVARLKQKTLSFLHDLGEVCQDSRCFIFWEKEEAIHHDEL